VEMKSKRRMQRKVDSFLGFHYLIFDHPDSCDSTVENVHPYSIQFWNALYDGIEELPNPFMHLLDSKIINDISVPVDEKGLFSKPQDQESGKLKSSAEKDTHSVIPHSFTEHIWDTFVDTVDKSQKNRRH